MRLATWNVNSVAARLPLVRRWVEAARPDVLCLQEIKCVEDNFPRGAFAELGYTAEVYGQPTYNGVAILSRGPRAEVRRGFTDDEEDAPARLLAATVEGVRVVNVYVPNGAFVGSDKYDFKLRWMERLRAFFDETCDRSAPVLLCGDFNVAPEDRDVHDPAAWRGKILCSEPERAALENVKEWGFVDGFRVHQKAAGYYSWWDYRAGAFRRNEGLRIDHVWISTALAKRSTGVWIDKEPRGWERPSDHTPVVIEFS